MASVKSASKSAQRKTTLRCSLPLTCGRKKNLDHSVRQMGEKVMPVGDPSAFCVPVVSLDGKFKMWQLCCVYVFSALISVAKAVQSRVKRSTI